MLKEQIVDWIKVFNFPTEVNYVLFVIVVCIMVYNAGIQNIIYGTGIFLTKLVTLVLWDYYIWYSYPWQ